MREEEGGEGRREGSGEIEAFRTLNSPAASPFLDNPSRSSAHHHRSGVEGVRPWSHVYGNHGNGRVADVDVAVVLAYTYEHVLVHAQGHTFGYVCTDTRFSKSWLRIYRACDTCTRAKARPQMTFARGWEEHELRVDGETKHGRRKSGINGDTSSGYEYDLKLYGCEQPLCTG